MFWLAHHVAQSREQQYFAYRLELYGGSVGIADDLIAHGVTNVLLRTTGETWEYPLWVFLKNRRFSGTVHQIAVTNETVRLNISDWPVPGSAVVSLDAGDQELPAEYRRIVQVGEWSIAYPSLATERDIKLIQNCARLTLNVERRGQLKIRCRVVDARGEVVKNEMIRITTPGYSHEFGSGPFEEGIACPVGAGPGYAIIGLCVPFR